MINITYTDILPNFDDIFNEFINNKKRELVILGKPLIGKKFWFQKYLKVNKIEYTKIDWIYGTPIYVAHTYYETLLNNNGKILFLGDYSTDPLFKQKLSRDLFLNVIHNKILFNPYPKSGLPEKFKFTGKIIIIDDPYVKVKKDFQEQINGYKISFSVVDLLNYFEKYGSSICKKYKISKEILKKFLFPYRFCITNQLVPEIYSPKDYCFSIKGVIEFCLYFTNEDKIRSDSYPKEILQAIEKFKK
jgi:hypothetical protein